MDRISEDSFEIIDLYAQGQVTRITELHPSSTYDRYVIILKVRDQIPQVAWAEPAVVISECNQLSIRVSDSRVSGDAQSWTRLIDQPDGTGRGASPGRYHIACMVRGTVVHYNELQPNI